ncbi:MAG: D-glycero-beta-D-manno-heptose 1,7-bisphosphate 7-phosphatase [Pseudomonadota bacterium]
MRLVILDRDGVINQDSSHYIKSPTEWHALPGSLDAIAQLNQAHVKVAVATNQSGIARGLFDTATLDAMHARMQAELSAVGGHIDHLVYCPHGPDEGCACRKPAPGLYHQIAAHFDCSLCGVPVVGDSGRDLAAAERVGASPVRVLTGKGQLTAREPAWANIPAFADLQHAIPYLLEQMT